jgi:phage regulator Rha-like protein
MNDLVLKNSEGQLVTTSLLVAQKFGKRHADVLRAIHDLETQISEVSKDECKRIFALTSQLVEQPNGGFRILNSLFERAMENKRKRMNSNPYLSPASTVERLLSRKRA